MALLRTRADAGDELTFVMGLLLNVLLLPVLLVEWTLLIALVPFAVPARLLSRRWTVEAHGRRGDGMLVRYSAVAVGDAAALRDAATAEILGVGTPSSLGEPIVTRVAADHVTDLSRDRLCDGG